MEAGGGPLVEDREWLGVRTRGWVWSSFYTTSHMTATLG
jgi:hypothetical protein